LDSGAVILVAAIFVGFPNFRTLVGCFGKTFTEFVASVMPVLLSSADAALE
jgi:hypothetical protein